MSRPHRGRARANAHAAHRSIAARPILDARIIALGAALGLGLLVEARRAAAAPPAELADSDSDAAPVNDRESADAPAPRVDVPPPDDGAATDEAPPPELAGDAVGTAQYWFARGNEHALAGRHAAAARAFSRSAAAVPTREAYYNEALAHELAGEPELAIVAFEAYLTLDLAARGPAPDAVEVRARLARLEGLVGWVVVRAPAGESFVGIEVDDLALDPRLRTETREAGGEVVISLHLRAGLHRLRFLRADGSSVERVVDVAGGERGELRLGADDATAPNGPGGSDGSAGGERGGGAQRPDAPIDQAGQDPRRGRRVARDLAISAGAVTGAGLVATVTFAGLTLDAKRDFEAALCDGACMDGERYPADEERRFERSRTATNVLAGVSAGFAAVTILVATLAARDDTRGGSRRRGAPSRDGRRAGDAASSRASIVRAAEEGRGSSRRVLVVDVQHGLRLRF